MTQNTAVMYSNFEVYYSQYFVTLIYFIIPSTNDATYNNQAGS
jgi:hypothetical protein